MRSRRVVPALVSFAAGLTASAAVRRLGARYRHRMLAPAVPSEVALAGPARRTPPLADGAPAPAAAADQDAVVLPFSRPNAPVSAPPATPARCGDNGGRTKSGAPCAARAGGGGRCHHHRLAA
jgi:hypothetical protein